MLTIYLSGPISRTLEKDSRGWREEVGERLREHGFRVLNPMRGQGFSKKPITANENKNPVLSDKALKKRDYLDVLESNIILANLVDASEVSLGTVAEIAIADVMNRLVIVAMKDDDPFHNHPFIRDAGVRFKTLEDAVKYAISCGVAGD